MKDKIEFSDEIFYEAFESGIQDANQNNNSFEEPLFINGLSDNLEKFISSGDIKNIDTKKELTSLHKVYKTYRGHSV